MMAVFALRFQNLPARNSSLKIFKHEKEEKLAGPKGKLAGPAQFLVAEGLGPALIAKTVIWLHRSGPILAQVMASCLTKPLHEPMLAYHQRYSVAFTSERCWIFIYFINEIRLKHKTKQKKNHDFFFSA